MTVRLTARGVGLLFAGSMLLVGGTLLGYAELSALGISAALAVGAAVAFVAWRPRLTIARMTDPDRVMRGEPCRITLDVTNAGRLFATTLVARERLRPGGAAVVPLTRLRSGRTARIGYPVPTGRRGLIRVGPLEVIRRDPLGLVGARRGYGATTAVWVRPTIHPIGAVPSGLSRSLDGRDDRVPRGSITFAGLREYVIGDDLRKVHWRTSARIGELMVREHIDTTLPRVVILLDDRDVAHGPMSNGESTFEAACEAAASVLIAAARSGMHVEVQLVTGGGAAGGTAEVALMLDLLTEASLGAASDSLTIAVERLRVRRAGDTLLYLAGAPGQVDLGLLAGLRAAYPSIIAGVFGPTGPVRGTGVLLLAAKNAADFARIWDGARTW